MNDLLFDVPWWLPALIAVIGLTLTVSGNRRQNERQRSLGLLVIAIAVGWALISFLVDTDKEKCQKLTKSFVQSVVTRDWTTFDNLMETNVAFRYTNSAWAIVGKDTLDNALRADINKIGVSAAHISSISAREEAGTITVHILVWSTQSATMDRPLDSEWEMDWQKSGGKFLLHEIRAIRVSNLSPEEIRGSLPVR